MTSSEFKVHLDILKKEHQELTNKYMELQRSSEIVHNKNGLANQLVSFVGELYNKNFLADITIKASGKEWRSHRFLLHARSHYWNDIEKLDVIELEGVESSVFDLLYHWLYTDTLSPGIQDKEILLLAKQACKYKFAGLKEICELWLTARVDVSNCIDIFEFAEQHRLKELSRKCSTLVTSRWSEFKPECFLRLSANILYRLLKGNTDNVLHSIIQLGREDVLLLFFIENKSKISSILNDKYEVSTPLEEALSLQFLGIATQLVQHGAVVNLIHETGDKSSTLLRMIRQENMPALQFLVKNNVNLNGIQDHMKRKTPLEQIISSNLSESLISWLEEVIPNMQVNFVGEENGRTPLSLASLRPSPKIVEILLKSGADPNLIDADGLFPLYHVLIKSKSLDIAQNLINAGANINATIGKVPLIHLLLDNLIGFKFLLSYNPDLDIVDAEGTPLVHKAISSFKTHSNSLELVQEIAKKNTNLAIKDSRNRTAIHLAVLTDTSFVKALFPHMSKFSWELIDDKGKTVLQQAIEKKDLVSAQLLIDAGAPINFLSSSLLIETLHHSNDAAAVLLLKNMADYHVRDEYGRSPLEIALANGLLESVRTLCANGVNLNERIASGYTVLETALSNGHMDCAKLLIDFGCDLHSWTPCDNSEHTLLYHMMDLGMQNAAVFLIENGADINLIKKYNDPTEDDGQSPLHIAVAWGLTEVIKVLIQHGADVNIQDRDDRTACHLATREGNLEALQCLLEADDVSFIGIRDKLGQTPLSVAISRKNHKTAAAIVERQPHAALQTNGNGENLLHISVRSNDLESVLFLLGTHTDPTRTTLDQQRKTALHLAASIDNELIMRNLILAGCVIDARSSNGSTPLHEAIRNRRANLVDILLENNANTEILDDRGECAYLTAVRAGSYLCLKVLLEHNSVTRSVINQCGQSSLHLCATLSSDRLEKGTTASEICELLLKHEEIKLTEKELAVFVDAKDKNGNTALLTAFMQGNAGVCRSLLKRGATMAAKNNDGITVFTYETPTKQLLFGLLESLEKEPRWSEGDACDCGVKFSITQRKHHCRHCGRVVCAPCSSISMPIAKFGEEKKVRICNICSIVLTEGGRNM